MLDRRSCLAILSLGLAPTSVLASQQGSGLNEELEPLREKHGLPALAAAVVKAGAIVASGATGVRAYNSTIRVTITDRFHIGSDTKAMTATLAGMAVDDEKLQWTSTIGDVLGVKIRGIHPRLAAVTLEQLLSHTSGIPSDNDEILKLYFSGDAFQHNLPAQRLRVLSAWKRHAPITPPGSAFHYANLGYMTAGAMIETAFGLPWEELITKRLYDPLGLSSAGLGPQATMGRLDAPVGHQLADDGTITPMPWGPAADVPPVIGPAGSAHLSVLDFAAWAGWNAGRGKRGPALLKPATLDAIYRPRISTGKLPNATPGTPQEGHYAFGWGVLKFDWTKGPVLEHNGSNSMNLAKILVDQEQDLGVVVMTNFPGKRAEEACRTLMETLYQRFAPTQPL
jgi:CubicO group peptidase (beta-lactamase class C family)